MRLRGTTSAECERKASRRRPRLCDGAKLAGALHHDGDAELCDRDVGRARDLQELDLGAIKIDYVALGANLAGKEAAVVRVILGDVGGRLDIALRRRSAEK